MKDQQGLWQEIWKPVHFDLEMTNTFTMEVSNFGRVRTFNKISKGKILKGSITEGYKVIRLKLFSPRSEKINTELQNWKLQLSTLYRQRRKLLSENTHNSTIEKLTQEIEKLKVKLSKKYKKDLQNRTIYKHFMVHRKVAELFLPIPSPKHTIVAHLDYDKLNNRVSNLKWMTPEENIVHQSKSPHVVADRKLRKAGLRKRQTGQKLDSTQVLLIKQQLKRSRQVKQIAKQFKVSEMQIYRIKSGENWSHVTLPE